MGTSKTGNNASDISRNFMLRILYTFLLVTSFTSCYTYKLFPKEDRHFVYHGEKKIAFVVNPELKKEYAILKKSGIFTLTTDSLSDQAIRVKLKPLSRSFICGNPLIASAFTLGQLPIYFPDTYTYQFQEISIHDTISREFKLQVTQRVWFWDMFALKKDFKGKTGQALLVSYYK